MIIKQKLKRMNEDTHKRETYLADDEFHSFQEVKDYCYKDMERAFISEMIVYKFVVMDTNEELEIVGSWFSDSDGCYYVKLESGF